MGRIVIQILDTTLREGEQTPGVYFDRHIKMAIADLLDKIGVDFIEAGHPAVNEEVEYSVKQLAQMEINAIIGAHSRSLKKDIDQALNCNVGFLGVFYCVSNNRLNDVFKNSIDNAIENITNIIKYAKEQNPNLIIRYTPEDTVRSDFENVLKVSVAAINAGADIISIADTTGYMIPGTKQNMYDYVSKFKIKLDKIGLKPKIAVHCHNDRGFALANAIDGYRAGANIIDVSVLGLGERAGIVDLAQLLVTMKADFNVNNNWNLKLLPDLYSLVSRFANFSVPVNFPIIGRNAFTHCAGIHTHAAMINPLHYQSLNPDIIGCKTEVCLDHMSGFSSVKYAIKQLGIDADNDLIKRVLDEVKLVGRKGRIVDKDELKYIVKLCEKRIVVEG